MGADEAGHGHRQTGNEDAEQQGDTTSRSRYRRATLLILTGLLTFLVSLLFMNPLPIGLLAGPDRGVPNHNHNNDISPEFTATLPNGLALSSLSMVPARGFRR